jgi:tetratricopeptide (TPR) repeat protein
MGNSAEALEAHGKAAAILQELAEANPADTEFQFVLTWSHNNIGNVLRTTGNSAEALEAHGRALAIMQKLTAAHPANIEFQKHLAGTYNNIGLVLWQMGKPAEALAAQSKALASRQKLVDAHPAVTEFQDDLAWCHDQIGNLLLQTGQPVEALAAHGKALAIWQQLVGANPANTTVQRELAWCHSNIGRVLARLQQFPEAFTALENGLAISRKLATGYLQNPEYVSNLGYSHAYLGGARVRAGQGAAAAADLRRAVELWAKVPPLDTSMFYAYHARFELARALALLAGLGKDPKSGVTTAEVLRVPCAVRVGPGTGPAGRAGQGSEVRRDDGRGRALRRPGRRRPARRHARRLGTARRAEGAGLRRAPRPPRLPEAGGGAGGAAQVTSPLRYAAHPSPRSSQVFRTPDLHRACKESSRLPRGAEGPVSLIPGDLRGMSQARGGRLADRWLIPPPDFAGRTPFPAVNAHRVVARSCGCFSVSARAAALNGGVPRCQASLTDSWWPSSARKKSAQGCECSARVAV